MKIILLERVPNLGQMGDEVDVKPGYARNFLLPFKKALRATDANRNYFEAQRKEIEAINLKRRQEAEAVAKKMDGAKVALIRQAGESGQLYGSATARDIAEGLGDAGFKATRSQIELAKPIKSLGIYTVTVRLHPEVTVSVKVNVARSEAEAEQQWDLGGALLGEEAVEEKTEVEEEAEIDTEQLVQDLLEEEARAEFEDKTADGSDSEEDETSDEEEK